VSLQQVIFEQFQRGTLEEDKISTRMLRTILFRMLLLL